MTDQTAQDHRVTQGLFLDCHQVAENCHVRLCVTSDPWVLNASVRLISHFCLPRLLTKGTQCHLTCMVNTSGPVKWDFQFDLYNEIVQKYSVAELLILIGLST